MYASPSMHSYCMTCTRLTNLIFSRHKAHFPPPELCFFVPLKNFFLSFRTSVSFFVAARPKVQSRRPLHRRPGHHSRPRCPKEVIHVSILSSILSHSPLLRRNRCSVLFMILPLPLQADEPMQRLRVKLCSTSHCANMSCPTWILSYNSNH